jgi:hypothetical protein
VNPDLLAVQPEKAIGPVRIGESFRTVDRVLGPAIERQGLAGRYAFGPIAVSVRANARRLVDTLVIFSWSGSATIAGHRLTDGYARLHQELPDWTAVECGNTQVLIHNAAGPVWTRIEFAHDQFEQLSIEQADPDPCAESASLELDDPDHR